jgi:hypothetical protein
MAKGQGHAADGKASGSNDSSKSNLHAHHLTAQLPVHAGHHQLLSSGHDPLVGLVALDSLAQRCDDERLDGDALAGGCHPHPVVEVVVHLVVDGACSLPMWTG